MNNMNASADTGLNDDHTGRRRLLQGLGGLAIGAALRPDGFRIVEKAAAAVRGDPQEAAQDEDFWFAVRQAYDLDSRYIILNAGASNPMPRTVLEAQQRYARFVNGSPFVNMYFSGLSAQRTGVRERLAKLINVTPDEVAITRNTTEGMNIVIAGLPLSAGDEILTTNYEYDPINGALAQRAKRDGIVVRKIALPFGTKQMADFVEAFRAGVGARTKLIVLSHSVNGIGQTLPVREICRMAQPRGIQVAVDGALSLGHIGCDMVAMQCDYFAASLHKWLSAPLGTGLLYIRKDRIKPLWPLYGAEEPDSGDIRKFERVGTRSIGDIAAIGPALDFYETLGVARKQARLHHLKRFWADQLAGEPRIRLGASLDAAHSCATLQLGIDAIPGEALSKHLLEKHRIYAFGPIKSEAVDGVYVSPNIFTSKAELQTFVDTIRGILRNGI